MSLIKCENLSFAYDGMTVVKNVNFELKRGDYLCIVGENGSGKSTLVKGLLGLKAPQTGRIICGDGFKMHEVGYMPQQTQVQKDFPAGVYEVVLSGRLNSMKMRPFYNKNDRQTALHNMRLMGIEDLKDRCFHDLSGGQQQRVLLARALCATKGLLLLDEPMTGLDPIVTAQMHKLISEINKRVNITIIMVSHDIHAAVDYSTHILHLGGDTPFFGTTEEYANSDIGKDFLCAWGGEHHEHHHGNK